MARTTERLAKPVLSRRVLGAVMCGTLAVGAFALTGCATKEPAETKPSAGSAGSAEDTRTGYGMGGVDQQIKIKREVIENRPAPWNLKTPESAVRSYLDWVSYAYRTSESNEATPTQSDYQVVRTDAYVQSNLQKRQLLDQTLKSITFGPASIEETKATLPAKEEWSYRYVSIEEAGKTIAGPYKASYDTVYSLVKTKNGWVVDDVEVKPLGEVK